MLGAEEHALRVDGEETVEVVDGVVLEDQPGPRRRHADVVEDDVEATEVGHRERDGRFDVGLLRHVALIGDRGATRLLDQLHGLLGALEVDVGDDDLGALLREAQRRGAADSRSGRP